jgi:hypothetical protein
MTEYELAEFFQFLYIFLVAYLGLVYVFNCIIAKLMKRTKLGKFAKLSPIMGTLTAFAVFALSTPSGEALVVVFVVGVAVTVVSNLLLTRYVPTKEKPYAKARDALSEVIGEIHKNLTSDK